MAKNSVLARINACAALLSPGNASIQLAQMLLEWHVNNELPTANAILQLKKEAARML